MCWRTYTLKIGFNGTRRVRGISSCELSTSEEAQVLLHKALKFNIEKLDLGYTENDQAGRLAFLRGQTGEISL